MKIYMHEFSQYLGELTHDDPVVRGRAVSGLAKYSGAEWQSTPDAVSAAVPALAKASRSGRETPADGAFRAAATKALGNIGAESAAIVPELLRLLQEDTDSRVRTEAAHGLGKLGQGAGIASRTLAVVMGDPASGDTLRGEAAWALARVAPLAPGNRRSAQGGGGRQKRLRRRSRGRGPLEGIRRGRPSGPGTRHSP